MMRWSRSQMVGSTRSHIFMILIYVLCLVCVIFGQSSNETYCAKFKAPGMTIPSGDIIIEEGKNLDIYCMLSDSYMRGENHFNSSHLVFYHDSNLLPSSMVQIVNATTIHLHIENMTSSYSNYYCKFKNGSNICYNKVAVDTKPRPVKNITCLSNNFENLTCTWQVPKHYVKTKYDLSFVVPSRVAQYTSNCPQNESEIISDNVYRCFWSLATNPQYRQFYDKLTFTMFVSNAFGNISNTMLFNHYAHVIPSRAEGLSVTNVTAYSAVLQWNVNVHLLNFPPGISYRLRYQSQFEDLTDWKSVEFLQQDLKNVTLTKQKYIYPLTNLSYANARYDIQLTSHSRIARSNYSWAPDAIFTFTTKSDLPNVPPKTNIGSFEIRENNNHREIYVYWQQIKAYQENGEQFNYTVVVRQNNTIKHIKPAEHERSYARFIELGFGPYDFEIFSTNEMGNSTNSTFVRVPSLKEAVPEPLSFTKIVYDKYTYELSWIAPKTKRRLSSYTIFWCKNLKDWPFQCTGLLNWTNVSSDITIWNITMKEDGIFQFAISANTEVTSSGMVWASCTVIHNKLQGKMKNLYAETKGSTVIEVNWKLDCSGRIGIVAGFRIYYCPIQKQENPQCLQPEKNITVPGDLSTVVGNLTHLIPFTLYRINVAVITRNDEGPKSDTKFAQTFETSPDTPRNVRVVDVTNTTITISWEPPTSVNGVLRYFEIRYVSLYNRSDMNKIRVNYTSSYFHKPTDNYTKTINGLRSFTSYSIDLLACTILCSEPYRLKKTTLYGVPDKMHKLTTTYVNNTPVFEWISPVTPGGPNIYQLLSEYSKDGVIHSNLINSTSSENSIMVPDRHVCESDSRITFLWRIRAIVLVDSYSGERLEGPWSDPINVPCTPPQASSLLMYCILFIFLLMAVCLFTFYGNKIWIHCKDMRNVEVKLPPGLTTTTGGVVGDVGTHWTPQGGLCISQLKLPKGTATTDTSHHLTHHIIAADEQLLLEKKREFDSELTDLSVNQSITMNLSNSETASVCNSSNESEISSSTPITTNLNISMNDDSSSSEKDTCSLRLRNVQTKPTGIVDTNPTSTPQSVWSKGYVTLPAPDKNDQFATGPWSKAMQLKALDGYSQIAVDAKQMQPPPPISTISTGYVPHNVITTGGGQQQPQPMMIIPRQLPQSSSSPNNEHIVGGNNSGSSSGGNSSSASSERPHYLLPQQKQDSLDDDDDLVLHTLDNDNDLDDIDDIYNLSEQDSPLVDLEPSSGEFSSIETDDLLNIDESDNEISCDSQVGGNINTANTTTPYVSLATAMSLTAPTQPTVAPPSLADQKLPTIVDNSQSLAQQPPVIGVLPSQSQPSSTNTKPTTPNPYSRIGLWDNTPSWPTQSSTIVGDSVGHSLSPSENKEFVVLSQPDGAQHHSTLDKTQPVASSVGGGKTSGYVPHRQFDCKLFKED